MSNYDGFRGWLNYIRDYKDNKDLSGENLKEKELNEEIEKLKKELKDREYIATEKDNLIALKDKRIEAMGNKISNYVKRNDELRSVVNTQYNQILDLEEQVKEKEQARRKNAGAIGGLKAKINELKEQLDKANYTIDFYRKSKKPNIEEIKAYELGYKEVEKRNKIRGNEK